MKKYIHVNMHRIRSNKKNKKNDPVITVKSYKDNQYGHEVVIDGPCKVVYRPCDPLSCGAVCWIETQSEVIVVDKNND